MGEDRDYEEKMTWKMENLAILTPRNTHVIYDFDGNSKLYCEFHDTFWLLAHKWVETFACESECYKNFAKSLI